MGYGFKQVFHSLSFRANEIRVGIYLKRLPRHFAPRNDDCGIRGFTLIELLVTISIIAILAAIGMVSYQLILKNSRDAKRQADLKLLQSALQQYHSDQFFYPNSQAAFPVGQPLTNCTGNTAACTVTKTYLSNIPGEPISGRVQYNYYAYRGPSLDSCDNSTLKCATYCLYVDMENSANAMSSPPVGCSATWPGAPGTYDFAVTPP